jgi:uncharacterized OB-fold protein
MVECKICGNVNQKKNEYCTECGTKIIANNCSQCGNIIKKTDKFCGECGNKVGEIKIRNKSNSQVVAKTGIKMDPSYHYYVDEKGNVSRKKGTKKEIVAKVGIKKTEGYSYFINEDGNVACIKNDD